MSLKPILLGLDLGSVTCGVAISDGLGMFAHPLTTIRFKHEDYDDCLTQLGQLVEKHHVSAFVLGFPKMMNNDIGPRGKISLMFKEMLQEEFNCSVHMIDERLTTVMSHKSLIANNKKRKDRKEIVDQVAAVQILQSYLDQHK